MIDQNKIYRVVCPGCGQLLGHVYPRHAEHLGLTHHCSITEDQHAQTIDDMKFALTTGFTQHLRDNKKK